MAFAIANWDKLSCEGNSIVPSVYSYYGAAELKATLEASAYFNRMASRLRIGDTIMVRGSDGMDECRVATVSPDVTLTVV